MNHDSRLTAVDISVGRLHHIQHLLSQVRHRLTILELLQVRHERLQAQLEVELEARDDRGHIIEFIKSVGEVFIYERVTNILMLEFTDQFRD